MVPVYAGCGAGAEWLDEIIAGYPRRCWLCRHLAIPLRHLFFLLYSEVFPRTTLDGER